MCMLFATPSFLKIDSEITSAAHVILAMGLNITKSKSTSLYAESSLWDFPGGPVSKSPHTMPGTQVQSLVRELDPTCCT